MFIIGAGVAGLSAIATASALGAKVYASDTRAAAAEQAESLGASFITIPGSEKVDNVYASAEQSEEFKKNQKLVYL